MAQENVGVAFALVIFAGASTAIGSSVVFFPSLVKYASKRTLAAGLGLSAGVMIYVSFVEIFQKSVIGFIDAGNNPDTAYVYATLCFFTGIFLMTVMNFVVHQLLLGATHHSHNHHHHHHSKDHHSDDEESDGDDDGSEDNDRVGDMQPICCVKPEQIDRFQEMGAALEEEEHHHHHDNSHKDDSHKDKDTNDKNNNQLRSSQLSQTRDDDDDDDDLDSSDQFNAEETTTEHSKKQELSEEETARLNRMSLNTAIAIAMHNFPEGLATFVAALADPRVGLVLAIAIAIHNVPEGLCVSLPVYYATGNRCRAFAWGCLSGISEPIAAIFGWAVLANSFSDELYGVLFGMVSGMMVIISAKELLPTAHRYDSDDSLVTNAFIIGMAIMALSLVLFLL
ncbi:Zinc transporter ZupT [Seminavis robusta]|uniref:Zinc transporter ZupT n=1 Tax=Seminavis robusta TaxID=568900 RepID=A0A9N8E8J1_9STRA|nr:Zinc transporter ZupT [Seminavis robusta]|eukprot:Sro666_g184020.1 Zinc transporter ZupT (395) ;mRNA; f:32332-33913